MSSTPDVPRGGGPIVPGDAGAPVDSGPGEERREAADGAGSGEDDT